MADTRRIVLHWIAQGHIAAADISRALTVADVLPSREGWRHFLDRLLLWMGMLFIASGLIFFLAYNWKDLGRYAKFSLAEALVVAALLLIWYRGLERPEGKAALFGASLFTGALLALIGQTYQTGADTFELFGTWAALILPWVLAGRLAALWLLWLTLVNVAIALYFQTFPSVFGIVFNTWRTDWEHMLWILFCFDTAALAVWEACAARGIGWLQPRWGARLVATASGVFVTWLAMMQITEDYSTGILAVPAWFAWLAAAWFVYRRIIADLFVLAGGVLSAIVVVTTFLVKHLGSHDAGGFLMTSLIVIAMTAAGGWWLKNLAVEGER